MNAVIEANDNIRIQPSTKGKSAEIELSTLPEYAGMLTFKVNGNEVSCPKFATVNGEFASSMYQIRMGMMSVCEIIIPWDSAHIYGSDDGFLCVCQPSDCR